MPEGEKTVDYWYQKMMTTPELLNSIDAIPSILAMLDEERQTDLLIDAILQGGEEAEANARSPL
jgi:hypothetical protein